MSAMTSYPGLFAKMLAVYVGAFDEVKHSDRSEGDLCEPDS
jgi:hypothetical protein